MSNDNRTIPVPVSLIDRIVAAISEVPNARIPATSTVRELTAVVREIWELRRAAQEETRVVVSVAPTKAENVARVNEALARLDKTKTLARLVLDGPGAKPWPVVTAQSSDADLMAAAKWWTGRRVLYKHGGPSDVRQVTSLSLSEGTRGRVVLSVESDSPMEDDWFRDWLSVGVVRRYGPNVPLRELGTTYPLVSEDAK